MDRRFFEIIKEPYVTEKSHVGISSQIYTFVVKKDASKSEIKKAFELLFSVKVKKVNTIKKSRKKKRIGKYLGYVSGKKIAIITLKEGEFLNVEDDSTKKSSKQKKQLPKLEKISEKLFDVTKASELKKEKEEKKINKTIDISTNKNIKSTINKKSNEEDKK